MTDEDRIAYLAGDDRPLPPEDLAELDELRGTSRRSVTVGRTSRRARGSRRRRHRCGERDPLLNGLCRRHRRVAH